MFQFRAAYSLRVFGSVVSYSTLSLSYRLRRYESAVPRHPTCATVTLPLFIYTKLYYLIVPILQEPTVLADNVQALIKIKIKDRMSVYTSLWALRFPSIEQVTFPISRSVLFSLLKGVAHTGTAYSYKQLYSYPVPSSNNRSCDAYVFTACSRHVAAATKKKLDLEAICRGNATVL